MFKRLRRVWSEILAALEHYRDSILAADARFRAEHGLDDAEESAPATSTNGATGTAAARPAARKR